MEKLKEILEDDYQAFVIFLLNNGMQEFSISGIPHSPNIESAINFLIGRELLEITGNFKHATDGRLIGRVKPKEHLIKIFKSESGL